MVDTTEGVFRLEGNQDVAFRRERPKKPFANVYAKCWADHEAYRHRKLALSVTCAKRFILCFELGQANSVFTPTESPYRKLRRAVRELRQSKSKLADEEKRHKALLDHCVMVEEENAELKKKQDAIRQEDIRNSLDQQRGSPQDEEQSDRDDGNAEKNDDDAEGEPKK
jgi:hypothetical protein